MPYKRARIREVLWPVTVETLADGGRIVKAEIKVRYRLLTRSELLELGDAEGLAFASLAAVIADHVTGWEGVLDEEGAPLAFSRVVLEDLLDDVAFLKALAAGLRDVTAGAPKGN